MNYKEAIISLIGKLDAEKESKFLSQILIMIKTHIGEKNMSLFAFSYAGAKEIERR